MAISAVDVALWDLKARLLGAAVVPTRSGRPASALPVYGSGGFTTYSVEQLQRPTRRLGGRRASRRVKMKIGSDPTDDLERVRAARGAIGPDAELFVDANGAYAASRRWRFAEKFAELGVAWFEEPVSSDDLRGPAPVARPRPGRHGRRRRRYGYQPLYFRRMLEAGAVDVLQADATRCGGITGFLQAAALCEAFGLPFSAHCAPALHLHPRSPPRGFATWSSSTITCGSNDAVRRCGCRTVAGPARTRRGPGLGLEFKHKDAERFQVWAAGASA